MLKKTFFQLDLCFVRLVFFVALINFFLNRLKVFIISSPSLIFQKIVVFFFLMFFLPPSLIRFWNVSDLKQRN